MEGHDEDIADTKAKGNEEHKPDGIDVDPLVRRAKVEYEEAELDEHVAKKVEYHEHRIQLEVAC